jgi:hypothetical protein
MIHGQDDEAAQHWDDYQKRHQLGADVNHQKGQVQ